MKPPVNEFAPGGHAVLLGADCGATHSVVLLAGADGRLQRRFDLGPANVRLLNDTQLRGHLRQLARLCPRPLALGLGFAGARGAADVARIQTAVERVWPGTPCWLGNDLETALTADETGRPAVGARVLVLSGTGACAFGRSAAGKTARVGGWGHVLGDRGSGYAIGREALRRVIEVFEETGRWPALGPALLRSLQFNEPEELVDWSLSAAKTDIAVLCAEVFRLAQRRDRLAAAIVREAAEALARDALTCARRLVGEGERMQFLLSGGVLRREFPVAAPLRRMLREGIPGAEVCFGRREAAWGAVELARRAWEEAGRPAPTRRRSAAKPPLVASAESLPVATGLASTEERNPRSMRLDRMALPAAVRLMIAEERFVEEALSGQAEVIARAVRLVEQAFRRGGRLFYVGAGTSGRLGVLDASECPPTFRAEPEMVQGLMAGGQRALWSAVEGAEDDLDAGVRAVEFRAVRPGDVVVGIAASGRTRFVWGALEEARRRGAQTILLCFNSRLRYPAAIRPSLVICPETGPELLTGSTRLKAGTATKLVLNILTTLAMVRLGKVASNLMIDLNPSNLKLRDRAVRIVQEITGAEAGSARQALEASGWIVKDALCRL